MAEIHLFQLSANGAKDGASHVFKYILLTFYDRCDTMHLRVCRYHRAF